MKKLLLAAALLLPAGLRAEEAACLQDLHGNVEVLRAGTLKWEKAQKGFPLREGDSVRTSRKGRCDLLFKDGTFVRLQGGSETLLQDLKIDRKERAFSFSFLRGKALWMVARLKRLRTKITVRTPSAVCAVRGTDFAVALSTSGETTVGMFEGKLSVSAGEEERVVPAGSEARVSGTNLKVQARLSRLMKAEERRYSKIKARVKRLRERLEEMKGSLDGFSKRRDSKLKDFKSGWKKKLKKKLP